MPIFWDKAVSLTGICWQPVVAAVNLNVDVDEFTSAPDPLIQRSEAESEHTWLVITCCGKNMAPPKGDKEKPPSDGGNDGKAKRESTIKPAAKPAIPAKVSASSSNDENVTELLDLRLSWKTRVVSRPGEWTVKLFVKNQRMSLRHRSPLD